MPRKGPVPKRDVLPDPLYDSKLVTRLINQIMVDGKRGKAQRILYEAFKLVEERSGQKAMDVFEEAMKNVMPVLEVRARDRKSTRLNSSHVAISYAVFCLEKKNVTIIGGKY